MSFIKPTSGESGKITLSLRIPAFSFWYLYRPFPKYAGWVTLGKSEDGCQGPKYKDQSNGEIEGPLSPKGFRSYQSKNEESHGYLCHCSGHDAQWVFNPDDLEVILDFSGG